MLSAWTRLPNTLSKIRLNATMPPLTPNTCYSGEWECTTCCLDYNTTEDQPWQTKDAALVCASCIIRVFELGLENDYTWPPRFGPDVLHSEDFASILPTKLLDRITERLSKGEPRLDPEEVAAATKGQIRDKDYQVCPGCSLILFLKDGCNHMECVCMAPFCFICGQVTQHNDNHFKKGGCPRWGQPTSKQAMFDHPDFVTEVRETHNNRMIQEFARYRLKFHADIWTWNVVIQTTTDHHLRFVMGDLLHGNLERLPTREHTQVRNAMRAQNPLHCVSDEQ